jgi:hypothetical protein
MSEFKKHFHSKEKDENALSKKHLQDLKSSHFGFKDVKKGLFTSDYEDRF